MTDGYWYRTYKVGVFHDDHFVEPRGVDVKNRYRQTLACGGVGAKSWEHQWELDEWAMEQIQKRERENASKQSD